MCQAIPRKVLSIAGEQAEVMYDGAPLSVIVRGIDDLQIGEYVVVYAGQALERIPTFFGVPPVGSRFVSLFLS